LKKLKKQIKGITLISLVVTIIVLLILAGVTIGIVSNGGIIGQAKDAVRLTKLAETKERLSMDILSAQMEGAMKGEELNKDQLTEIVNKYGELQEDGDIIKTDNGDISLKDILEGNNEIPEDQKKKIAELENRIKELEEAIESLNKQLEDEKNNKQELEEEIANLRQEVDDKQNQIDELNRQLADKNEELENKNGTIAELEKTVETLNNTIETLNTQIADLKSKQATGNATVADVLKGKTFSNSSAVGLTGTMPSYTSGSTAVTASGKWGFDTTYGPWLYAPNNAYYGTGHWFNIPWATIRGSLGDAAAGNVLSGKTFTSTNGIKIGGSMPNRGALNWSGSNTTYSVPAGYYSGGTLDSRPSYNAGVAAADNRPNANSTNYKTGYNAGVNAGKNISGNAKSVVAIHANNGGDDWNGFTKDITVTASVTAPSGATQCLLYLVYYLESPTNRYVFGQSGGTLVREFYSNARESSNGITGLKAYVRQYSVSSGTVIKYTMSATGSYSVRGHIRGLAIFL